MNSLVCLWRPCKLKHRTYERQSWCHSHDFNKFFNSSSQIYSRAKKEKWLCFTKNMKNKGKMNEGKKELNYWRWQIKRNCLSKERVYTAWGCTNLFAHASITFIEIFSFSRLCRTLDFFHFVYYTGSLWNAVVITLWYV